MLASDSVVAWIIVAIGWFAGLVVKGFGNIVIGSLAAGIAGSRA